MPLTKRPIIEQISELGFSKNDSTEIVEALLAIIKSSLENGEDVLISGFGKFQVKEQSPRKGRNFVTNEDMLLYARKVVTFQCSGKLRARINERKK